MLEIIQNNLKIATKTLSCLIFDKIKKGIELNDKEYSYWLKIKRDIDKYELIENGCILYYLDGDKEYYKNGLLHRDNGPAVILSNGHKEYYKNGKLHREDGPAEIWPNGYKVYYKNGKWYPEKEYWKIYENAPSQTN